MEEEHKLEEMVEEEEDQDLEEASKLCGIELRNVNFTAQGLTMIPAALFNRNNIYHLNLSGNNIRTLPASLGSLTQLRRLNLSKNSLRCIQDNDFNCLPLQMTQLIRLQELNISECNIIFVPATVWRLVELRVLDISRNKLSSLPPEIGLLNELRFLNAQQTGLKTLPPEIVCCDELESLLLFGNPIETLPDTMRELHNLTVLTLNGRNFSQNFDDYMIGLLQRNQISSEHIPPVVFEIQRLKSLDLENCKLNTLPESINEGLVQLTLNKNYFHDIPPAITELHHLSVLELSDNSIKWIPSSIRQLKNLERLIARNNRISEINQEIGDLEQMNYLDLGGNQIGEIPSCLSRLMNLEVLILDKNNIGELSDAICDLTSLHTLDLTANQVTKLPIRMYQLVNLKSAHTFNGLFRQGLWLHKNPLVNPPQQIWKTTHPEKIWDSLKKMVIRNVENLQPLKIVVLANHNTGKTSLVNSLIAGKSMMADSGSTTSIFDVYKYTSPNNVKFVFFDVGCHEVFETLIPRVIDPSALILLAFDASTYEDDGFKSQIGKWLHLIAAKAPKAVVKLVGVKCDRLISESKSSSSPFSEEDEEVMSNDEGDVMEDVETKLEVLEDKEECHSSILSAKAESEKDEIPTDAEETEETEKSEENEHEDTPIILPRKEIIQQSVMTELSLFKEEFEEKANTCEKYLLRPSHVDRLKFHLLVQPEVSFVSCDESLDGIQELVSNLEFLAVDLSLFPNNQCVIPNEWMTFCSALKREKGHVVEWAKVKQIGEDCNIVSDLKDALIYLSSIGEILWFAKHPTLNQFVFHRLQQLKTLLRCLIRVDFEDLLEFQTNPLFNCKGQMKEEEFEQARYILLKFGQVSLPVLKCFAFGLDFNNKQLENMCRVVELFNIGFSVPLPEIPTGKLFNKPVFVLPQFVSESVAEDFWENDWPAEVSEDDDIVEENVTIFFPMCRPIGLFTALVSQLNSQVEFRIDHAGLVYANAGSTDLLFVEMNKDEEEDYSMKLSVRHKSTENRVDFLMWFRESLDAFMKDAPGLIVCEK